MSEQSDGGNFSHIRRRLSGSFWGRGRKPHQPQPVRMSTPLIPSPILRGLPVIRSNGYSQWIEGESERHREGPIIHSYGRGIPSGAGTYHICIKGERYIYRKKLDKR